MKVKVNVQRDHLERMATAPSPTHALAELVWNSLDADATRVEVKIDENALGGIEQIRVTDNGLGIDHDAAVEAFKRLGGSWKEKARRTQGGRSLHGRAGEGRFSAFALGKTVKWRTRCRHGKALRQCEISGSIDDIGVFEVTDPEPAKNAPGTEVVISGIERHYASLKSDAAIQRFTELFALYLRDYKDVSLWYDGVRIDPAAIEDELTEISLPDLKRKDGREVSAFLTLIEWKVQLEKARALVLCDAGGVTIAHRPAGIQAPGFNFTAYLKSDLIRELHEKHRLDLDDLEPDLDVVVTAAKDAMREHFRKRAAEQATTVVEKWKEQKIYPYEGKPRNIVEKAERQVFDVVALNINSYLPAFEAADDKSKKLSLHMLKTSLEQNPQAVQKIIQDVLDLPKEKQDELAGLLERTSLTAIINAAKVVADRLDFLLGLETLVFEAESKKRLKERQQLHRILAENTWVFGEEFNLAVDDQSMREVLRKHLELLDRKADDAPVLTIDRTEGIVDLMLSRRIPQVRAEEREHLVIELKRPLKRLDVECCNQIERYAFTVAEDERFKDTETRWIFWLVSNDMDDHVRRKTTGQQHRPDGVLHAADDRRMVIWVKTWAQVIQSCKARLQFFQDRLQYMADANTALEHLQKTHEKYLPKHLRKGAAGVKTASPPI
jgi:hypothetical protein